MQGLVMVGWGGWLPASWTAWPPSPCPAMDMASDMNMAFSIYFSESGNNKKSEEVTVDIERRQEMNSRFTNRC